MLDIVKRLDKTEAELMDLKVKMPALVVEGVIEAFRNPEILQRLLHVGGS